MMRPFAIVLGALALPMVACAQAPAAPVASVDSSVVYGMLTALAHDSMQGRRTGTPGGERTARYIAGRMRALGLEPAGDDGFLQRIPLARRSDGRLVLLPSIAALDTIPADQRAADANVIGMIRGTDPALRDEVVVVGAHHDHVGIRSGETPDSIFNGADDDASGVVAVLEIARALRRDPPARTVVVVTFAGEEMGLLGTRWYLDHPTVPLAQMVAQLQVEMIGRPDSLAGGPGRAWLTGYERSTMGRMLATAGIPIVPDPRPEQNFFERSDNIAFARLGIPAHTISSFGLHADYHRPSDDIDGIDVSHLTTVIEAAIAATRILADSAKVEWIREPE